MATLRLIEGFEVAADATTLAGRYGSLSGVAFVAGRTMGTALEVTHSMSLTSITPSLGISSAEKAMVVGVAVWCDDIASQPIIVFRRGGADQCALWLVRESASSVHLDFRTDLTVLASTVSLPTGRWYYIEARVEIGNVDGIVEVRVDQAPVIDLTSVDTQATGAAGVDGVAFRMQPMAGGKVRLDDIYAATGTGGLDEPSLLGDVKTLRQSIVGDGGVSEWTSEPMGASNSSTVDDVAPDDDSTYITSLGGDELSTFRLSSVAALRGRLLGMTIAVRSKDDLAAGAMYRIVQRDPESGSLAEADPITAPVGFTEARRVFETSAHGLPLERQDFEDEVGVRAV